MNLQDSKGMKRVFVIFMIVLMVFSIGVLVGYQNKVNDTVKQCNDFIEYFCKGCIFESDYDWNEVMNKTQQPLTYSKNKTNLLS